MRPEFRSADQAPSSIDLRYLAGHSEPVAFDNAIGASGGG
jgi:hypothetical protein